MSSFIHAAREAVADARLSYTLNQLIDLPIHTLSSQRKQPSILGQLIHTICAFLLLFLGADTMGKQDPAATRQSHAARSSKVDLNTTSTRGLAFV